MLKIYGLKAKEKMKQMKIYFLFLCLIVSSYLQADPWGKDAELVKGGYQAEYCPKNCTTPILGTFAEMMISFHQNVISPADGPRSNFIPSSSQYTLDAMRKYGFFQGFSMGCDRLMRENQDPWVYHITINGAGHAIKYDPVP
jgi:putative component of membrane protein insertase Oxa1/YidC/SpoIIIJ protein YidD